MNDNEILNSLDTIDRSITVALNYDGGPVQDDVWTVFSSRLIWALPALALIAHLLYNKRTRKKTVVVVLALALVVTLCDQTTSGLMKPLFARLRPSHTPGVMHLLHYVDGLSRRTVWVCVKSCSQFVWCCHVCGVASAALVGYGIDDAAGTVCVLFADISRGALLWRHICRCCHRMRFWLHDIQAGFGRLPLYVPACVVHAKLTRHSLFSKRK